MVESIDGMKEMKRYKGMQSVSFPCSRSLYALASWLFSYVKKKMNLNKLSWWISYIGNNFFRFFFFPLAIARAEYGQLSTRAKQENIHKIGTLESFGNNFMVIGRLLYLILNTHMRIIWFVNNNHRNLTHKYIARHIIHLIWNDHKTHVSAIKQEANKLFPPDCSFRKGWYAQKAAIGHFF